MWIRCQDSFLLCLYSMCDRWGTACKALQLRVTGQFVHESWIYKMFFLDIDIENPFIFSSYYFYFYCFYWLHVLSWHHYSNLYSQRKSTMILCSNTIPSSFLPLGLHNFINAITFLQLISQHILETLTLERQLKYELLTHNNHMPFIVVLCRIYYTA